MVLKFSPDTILLYRAAAWIRYYWLLPDIIGYFLYSCKSMNFQMAKMYGNNGTFYGGKKYRNSSQKVCT